MIKAKIVAHSLSPQGDELISVLATFPRIILSEVNTHRMLSKNTSSSRAIPFKKMVEIVQNDPFVPIAWQKTHSGMQGSEYISTKDGIYVCNKGWLEARDNAVKQAMWMNSCNVTKQLCNRLLEPFMWTTMLITGSREGWDNFFNLRCSQYKSFKFDTFHKSKKEWLKEAFKYNIDVKKSANNYSELDWLKLNKGQAEIHIMDLAEKIYDAMNESTPKQLQAGEWHIPFGDKIHIDGLQGIQFILKDGSTEYHEVKWITEAKVKISTAMAARTSYTVVGDEKEIDYKKMVDLHDRLIAQDPPHSSPMEHCARAMSDEEYRSFFKGEIEHRGCERENYEGGDYSEDVFIPVNGQGWCRNFKGFIPYRHIVETNN